MRSMAANGDGSVGRDQTSELQLLVDSAPSLIHTARPDGYLDFFNQTWLSYFGRPLEDLRGWKWTAVIHPEDVEGIVEKWRASLASGEPFLHEARVLRADGEYRWMLTSFLPRPPKRTRSECLVATGYHLWCDCSCSCRHSDCYPDIFLPRS